MALENTDRGTPVIELKGTTLSVIAVLIGSGRFSRLREAIDAKLGSSSFFEGEAAVLDFSRRARAEAEEGAGDDPIDPIDLTALVALLRRYGLTPVAVRALPAALTAAAETLGLASVPATTPVRAPAVSPVVLPAPAPVIAIVGSDASVSASGESDESAMPATHPAVFVDDAAAVHGPEPSIPAPEASMREREPRPSLTVTALVVDGPLRSGQRVYAQGRDLVVLGPVNPGAELIADGSIHVYGRLRGRVLAGASGDKSATIVAANFQAELVSIAGVYKTFEVVPAEVAGKLIRVRLHHENGESRIALEPIPTN